MKILRAEAKIPQAEVSSMRDSSRKVQTPGEVIAHRRKKLNYRAEISTFLTRAVVLVIVAFILMGLIFGITPMANNDMSPRISAGDLLFYYRLEKEFVSSDVVVYEKENETCAGRIIAKGGDTVEITEDCELKVNGSIVMENDIYYITPQYDSEVTYPVVLGKGEYFVLGDYREGAKDSRYYGAVDEKEIKGKVITVIRRSNL